MEAKRGTAVERGREENKKGQEGGVMGGDIDKIIYREWIARLANMIYDIKKSWTPNDNLDKAIPHLEEACKLVKAELKKEEE